MIRGDPFCVNTDSNLLEVTDEWPIILKYLDG